VRPTGSSSEITARIGHLWKFRDGKIQSMEGFPEREKALAAAGLPPADPG